MRHWHCQNFLSASLWRGRSRQFLQLWCLFFRGTTETV